MGSELFTTLKEQGRPIKRGGGESAEAFPEEFTVVGVDISAEALCALYPDKGKMHARARAIVLGVRDKTRTAKAPTPAFVSTLRRGVRQTISLANLGPDTNGRIWIVVVIGRKRTLGLRIWNEANPEKRHEIKGMLEPLVHNSKAGIDAELEALEANAESNVFEAMEESSKADHALMLSAKGRAPEDIVITIGARNVEHVGLLLLLAECCDEVKEAVDAGRIGIAEVADLAKHKHDVQRQRILRRLAGPNRANKDAASPPRPKARSAKTLEAMEAEVWQRTGGTTSYETADRDAAIALARLEGAAAGLAYARGGEAAQWLADALAAKGTAETAE